MKNTTKRKLNPTFSNQIEFKEYEKYSEIPEDIRKVIMQKLGISAGFMREWAKKLNPYCIVAFDDQLPIGWITLNYKEHVMVFVKKSYRNRGIGNELVVKMSQKFGAMIASSYNDASANFWFKFRNVEIDDDYIDRTIPIVPK